MMLGAALAMLLAAHGAPELITAGGRWAAFKLEDGRCEARGRAWRHLPDSQRERQPMMRFIFDPRGRVQAVEVNLRRLSREGSSVMVAVDETSFLFEGRGRTAVSEDGKQALALIGALRSGDRMRVTANSAGGGRFTDYYPLEGINSAIDAAAAACANSLEK